MKEEEIFYRLLSLGILRPLLKISKKVRWQILEGVYFNTDLITSQLAKLDMLTDSRMHRISKIKRFLTNGAIEVYAIKFEKVLKEFSGFSYVFPVAQGRQAEQLLSEALAPSGKIVITNGLFVSTYFHSIKAGAKIIELSVAGTSSDNELFQGNLNITELQELTGINHSEPISHVYIECCNNALGGKPISYDNIEKISEICRSKGILLIIDATRIFQNAELIRRNEPGFKNLKLSEIVLKIFKLADGCTISSTKEANVETGGIIGINDPKLALILSENLMLHGEGLSVRLKAQLCRAYSRISKMEMNFKYQINAISKSYTILRKAGVPVVGSPGGVGVFVFTGELQTLKIHNPEKSFLASLYYNSGILGSLNYTTPALNDKNLKMIRFVITPGMADYRTIRYFTNQLIKAWKQKDKLRGLEKTWQPEGKAGEYFVKYKLAD
jgi:tryptophanase